MKQQMLYANESKGACMFHAWNGNESFYIHTQNGRRGIEKAHAVLKQEYGKMYLSYTTAAPKSDVKYFFQ